jgi:hypothetical protein
MKIKKLLVKDKKRGIMARIQEKIESQETEKAKENEEDLMQQAMADPTYQAEIAALKSVKKTTGDEEEKLLDKPVLSAEEKA